MPAAIEQDIVIDAPVDVVWRTLTEPDQISKWFAEEVDLTVEPGATGSVTFLHREQPNRHEVTVQSVEPPRSFSYRWLHARGADAQEGNSTLVVFTLAPEGDGTRLRVVETGVEAMDWPPEQRDAFAQEHNQGWVHFLGRLGDLVGQR